MLINPNLINTLEGINYNQINKNDRWRNVKIPIPNNLIDGETYTFSCKIDQSDNGTGYASVIIADKNLEDTGSYKSEHIKIGINDFKTTFTYNKSNNDLIIVYNDIFGKTAGIDAEFEEYKLEEGRDKTIYIPNENYIETAKHQYFLAGGVRSKRCIQSSNYPRQSSFRKEVAA